MRKTLMSVLVGSTLAASSAAMAAPLILDLNGLAAGGEIVATSIDWGPTSFLAMNGKAAIAAFLGGGTGTAIQFDVLTHAKLSAYNDANGDLQTLPAFGGEITVVSRFTERVTAASVGSASASFETVGPGWIEIYYSAASNSNALTGSNYNDGTLILQGIGVGAADGTFEVNGARPISLLDQSGNGNQYGPTPGPTSLFVASGGAADQRTVQGSGGQDPISFGTGGFTVFNTDFFKTAVADFSLIFANISISLPFTSVDPSDCFNPLMRPALPGPYATQCLPLPNHVDGLYSVNATNGGYLPVVGNVNGLFTGPGPDFVAQTDFNSSVSVTVPEPGMLALLGLAFAGLGMTTMRRRSV